VPDWLANLAALAWRVIAIAVLAVVVWFIVSLLWTVTASIAVAIVVSAVVAPWVRRLTRSGRSRTAAAAIAWGIAMVSIVGIVLLLALAFLPYVVQVVTRIEAGVTTLQAELAALGIPPAAAAAARALFATLRDVTAQSGGDLLATIGGVATVLVLSSFLVFFFVRDGDRAWGWAIQGLPDEKRDRLTAAGSDALVRVGGYLRGTAVLSGLIALSDLVFMLVLGVPLAVPLSVLVFFAGFIPYFGGIVTTALVLLVTLAALGPWSVVVFIVLISIRNMILSYGVRPTLYGRSTSIHPALVLIALPAGYQLAGIIGLFVAVPVTAVVLAVAGAVVAMLEPDERPQLPALIPAWFDRIAQWSWRLLLGLALVAVAIGIFIAVPTVVIPLVLAIVLTATLEPGVAFLMRRGRSRAVAAGMVVGGGFLAVMAILVLALASLVGQAGGIADGARAGAEVASGALGGHLGPLVMLVATGGGAILETVRTMAQGLATVAVIVVLSELLAFYLLRDGGRLWGRVVEKASPPVREEVRAAGSRAFDVLGGYMSGTALISLVGAGSQLFIMLVLGIDLALPVFVLSFFLCFIPYVGGFISTGIALLLTIATGSPVDIAVMAVFTLVFNIVTGNIVTPIVYNRTVHLHAAIVLVAIPAGGAIAGVLGMFFIVPAIAVVAVTWRSVLIVMGARARRAAVLSPAVAAEQPVLAPSISPAEIPLG